MTGGSVVLSDEWGSLRVMTGVDLDVQQARRRRYDNLSGAHGPLVVRQSETVRSYGPFAQAEWSFANGAGVVGGLRYDWTEFDLGDRCVSATNDDVSDTIRFRQLSPRIGFHVPFNPGLQIYGNISTAFQVPTTTELKPPDRPGGFDSDREPERALAYEVGAKGKLGDRIQFDLALFDIRVADALVPFDDSQGETFFRNAGEVRRRGAELTFSADLAPGLSFRGAYTYANYRFHDYDRDLGGERVDLDGKREPNIPTHSVGAELRYRRDDGWFGSLSLRHFSDLKLDDANRFESSGATTSDLRIGYERESERFQIRPFFGVRNWTNKEYNGTVRPNAFGGRFLEPAPELELYGGIAIEFRRP